MLRAISAGESGWTTLLEIKSQELFDTFSHHGSVPSRVLSFNIIIARREAEPG